LRDILTGLAVILIVLLTGALVVPRVLTWSDWRQEVNAELSRRIGVPVATEGAIRIVLLPTPSLSLRKVKVGKPELSNATIESLHASMSLTALLRGELRIKEATVKGASFKVRTSESGDVLGLPGRTPGSFAPESVVIEKLEVATSDVTVEQAGNPDAMTMNTISGEVEASSLIGPFRGSARFTTGDGPANLRIAGGKLENGRMRVKGLFEDENRAARVDLDGTFDFAAAPGKTAQIFQGQVAASGNVTIAAKDGFAQVLWRLVSPAAATREIMALDGLELTLGEDSKSAKFGGAADVNLSSSPSISAVLSARQIDLDRIFAVDSSGGKPRSPAQMIDIIAASLSGRGLSPDVAAKNRPALPAHVEVTVGNVVLGGDVVSGLIVHGQYGGSRVVLDRVQATLPGRTELDISGTISPGDQGGFDGNATLSSKDGRRLINWYAGGASDIPIKVLEATGKVAAGPGLLMFSGLDARIDEGRLTGSVERRTEGSVEQRPSFRADLKGDGLPLELTQIFSTQGDSGTDLDLSLDLANIRAGSAKAGRLRAHAVRNKAGLAINDVEVENLGGMRIKGRSSLGSAGGSLVADVEIPAAASAIDLLRRAGYEQAADILAARAPALGSISARITGESRSDGAMVRTSVALDGKIGATAANGILKWVLPAATGEPLRDVSTSLSVRLASPRSAQLLAQLGLDTIAVEAGPAELTIDSSGDFIKGMPTKIAGTVAGSRVLFDGALRLGNMLNPFDGLLEIETTDLAPLAQVLAIASPPVPPRTPAKITARAQFTGFKLTLAHLEMLFAQNVVKGEVAFDFLQAGRIAGQLVADSVDARLLASIAVGERAAIMDSNGWSTKPFGPAQPPVLLGDVWIDAKKLTLHDGLTLENAGFVYRFENGLAFFEHADLRTPWGRFKVGLSLRRSGPGVAANIRLDVDGLSLPFVESGALTGRVGGTLSVVGQGNNVQEIVRSLAGGGTLQHSGIAVARLEPEALERTLSAFLESPATPDAEAVQARFEQEIRRGPQAVPGGQTSVIVAQGSLRVGPVTVRGRNSVAELGLTSDLDQMKTEARAEFVSERMPAGWSGGAPRASVLWSGPLFVPQPRVDVAILANGLVSIGIARDLDRIQILEQDGRERSFFNRRLRAAAEERKRLEEERRAAEDARRAEDQMRIEDSRKAEELRRAEEIRRFEEARRAEDLKRQEEQQRDQQRLAEQRRKIAEEQRKAEEARLRRDLLRQTVPRQSLSDEPDDGQPPVDLRPPGGLLSPPPRPGQIFLPQPRP
jgi:AsmA family